GSIIHVAVQGAVELAQSGEPAKATGTTIDVTETHMAADAVLLAKQLLEAFVDHAPAPVAMFDKNMNYVVHSRRWQQDGQWEGNLRGKNHFELFPRDEKWRAVIEACCAGQTLKGTEEKLTMPNGAIAWINWEANPWRDHKGEIGGAIVASEDVTREIEA